MGSCRFCEDKDREAGQGPEKHCPTCEEGRICCKTSCDTPCTKCKSAASVSSATSGLIPSNKQRESCPTDKEESALESKETEPCSLLQKEREAARKAHELFGFHAPCADSFALDVVLGNIPPRSSKSIPPATYVPPVDAGDLQHKTRCQQCAGQGGLKPGWCEHPHELWNRNGSTLSPWALAVQIRNLLEKRAQLENELPPSVRALVMRRLGHLEQVARLWRELEDEHWLPDYADGLGEQIIGLRHAGISNLLPKRLQPEGNGYSCVDEHGQNWGRLRGHGSLVSRIEAYMLEHGTSYDWISNWMGEVSGDSWSQWGKAMRIFWVRQRDQKKVKVLEHYWNNPSDPVTAAKTCAGLYTFNVGQGYEKEPQLKRAWQIWHGFVQELLACTDFPNNDREARTVRLIRTENDAGLKANKLTPFEPKKDSEIKRGVCESSSIFKAFVNAGPHITLQTVPHIRVITCYFTERTGGANRCCLKEDHENEFIFLTHGIRCDYEPSGGSSTQEKSEEDKYKDLFGDYAPFGSSSTQTQSNADKYKGLFDE